MSAEEGTSSANGRAGLGVREPPVRDVEVGIEPGAASRALSAAPLPCGAWPARDRGSSGWERLSDDEREGLLSPDALADEG